MNLWAECNGAQHIQPLATEAWRIVEAQHISATRKLVDSIAEHIILEDLIEQSKPAYANESFIGLHYLLATPFRYPPLLYGSRFGTKNEPSLWYGSLDRITALAEVAYYRCVFLAASQANFGLVETEHSAFAASIKTVRGLNLQQMPFVNYKDHISAPADYSVSQALGAAMRTAQVEAFCYHSARDVRNGLNVALFTPKAFAGKKPKSGSFQTWHCLTTPTTVEFSRSGFLKPEPVIFRREEFMVDDVLPLPFAYLDQRIL